MYATQLPQKPRANPVTKIVTSFCPKSNRIFIVANEKIGGYSGSLWSWQGAALVLETVLDMDPCE